jgi:hypothetical protein
MEKKFGGNRRSGIAIEIVLRILGAREICEGEEVIHFFLFASALREIA